MYIDVKGDQMDVNASPHNADSGFVASMIFLVLPGNGLL